MNTAQIAETLATYNLHLNIDNVLENIQHRQANLSGNVQQQQQQFQQQQQLQVPMVYYHEESLESLLEEGKLRALRTTAVVESQWVQQHLVQ